jgi:hypothetical protein
LPESAKEALAVFASENLIFEIGYCDNSCFIGLKLPLFERSCPLPIAAGFLQKSKVLFQVYMAVSLL